MKLTVRIVLSLFVLYHLAVILTFPNANSIQGRSLTPWLLDYANFFNFNTTWQFFSPDPTSHIFLSYDAVRNPDSEEIPETFRWPPERKEFRVGEYWFRLVYHSRYMIMSQERVENYLLPWFCRLHPEAKQIVLKGLSEDVPTMEIAQLENKNFEDMKLEQTWATLVRDCERP